MSVQHILTLGEALHAYMRFKSVDMGRGVS